MAESIIGTIKTEFFAELVPDDIHHAQRMLFPYVEGFYNRKCLHSALGYLTPTQAESTMTERKDVA